ncbi:anti-sigma factor antagonist [Streptomyces lucensis JCM 4490]|uniref:Anti-sigma factor antagonist n=1 Tax=Streptomyces lucensis JCM 4490 TaxID=1306176 RepID=A0A918JA16_9ACTN|nr:STAS domain-containing protein [Streptomyces lucensis]GGW65829.1 anti-sigma factor antagonist [Streptomyces lucensis JCM 4490]
MSWDEAVMPKFTSNAGGMRSSARHGERAPGAAVTAYERGGAWVVAAHGSYDTYSIAPLAHALDAAARKYPKVVLDASGVDFGDSALLNLLILTHQAGNLRVAAPPQQLQRLFEMTGVDTVLEIRETVDAAAVS